ncbi:MAG: glycosyltransferase family 39 protein [Elusimicrobiota bacterium]
MGEENKPRFLDSFRKKLFANRIAIESVLFERDKPKEEKKKDYKPYFYLTLILLLFFILNFLYFYRNSGIISYNDLKSLEYARGYADLSFKNILLYSDISHINFDMPLYYLLYLPFIKLMGEEYAYSIFWVNFLCILIASFGIYFLISESRNKNAALCGVVVFLSMPFVIDLSRKFSPTLLTLSIVIWNYYLFIKVENFEETKYTPLFVIFFILGLFTDKLFFIYILPLMNFVSLLTATSYSYLITRFVIPAFFISAIFYARFIMIGSFEYIVGKIKIESFWNFNFYFKEIINSVGLLFFSVLILLFVWMFFARYMQYKGRKILFKWLLIPIFLFSLFPFTDRNFIYPVLPSLIIGGVIMIPPVVRKYFIFITLFLMLVINFPFFKPVYLENGYKLFGLDHQVIEKHYLKNIIYVIKEDIAVERIISEAKGKLNKENIIIGVEGRKNEYLNYYVLNNIKESYGLSDVRFVHYPRNMYYFLDYLIITDEDAEFIDKNVFTESLRLKNLRLFKKRSFIAPVSNISNHNKIYNLEKININGLELEGISISLYGYNEEKGIADYALINANYANYKGIDIYSLKLKLLNFTFSVESPVFVTGFSRIEVIDCKISDFSVSRFIEDALKYKNVEVEFFEKILKFKALVMNRDFSFYSTINIKDNNLYLSVYFVNLGGFKIPQFLCKFLNFKFDINKFEIPVKLNKITISKGIIHIQ